MGANHALSGVDHPQPVLSAKLGRTSKILSLYIFTQNLHKGRANGNSEVSRGLPPLQPSLTPLAHDCKVLQQVGGNGKKLDGAGISYIALES